MVIGTEAFITNQIQHFHSQLAQKHAEINWVALHRDGNIYSLCCQISEHNKF